MSYPKGIPPKLIRDIDKLHPKMKIMTELFLKKCKVKNIPIFITQTFRTAETQAEYYSWGRTKTNPFRNHTMVTVTRCDGYTYKSRHQYGLAIDIACSPPNKLYDYEILKKAGEVAESLGLTWGGRWKDYQDAPHIEIPTEKVHSFKVPDEKDFDKLIYDGIVEDEEMVEKQIIVIDGQEYEVNKILKDNQNFIKLADLRDLNMFKDVKFDNLTKKIIIETK